MLGSPTAAYPSLAPVSGEPKDHTVGPHGASRCSEPHCGMQGSSTRGWGCPCAVPSISQDEFCFIPETGASAPGWGRAVPPPLAFPRSNGRSAAGCAASPSSFAAS